MKTITVYGIPNCDTVKKTLNWLKEKEADIVFHDYKKLAITKAKLTEWCRQAGWQVLLNKKSTTWRSLPVEVQNKVTNQSAAIGVMMDHASLIKRPVMEIDGQLLVGFDENFLSTHFK